MTRAETWSKTQAPHPPLEVREHQLHLVADPLRMKIIAEAVGKYMDEHSFEDTTLSDFRYNMEASYQSFYSLDQDDWDFVPEHKEQVHGAF